MEMQTIDVEKIMDEIRQEIREKGYNDSMLSFKDVDSSEYLKKLKPEDVFDLAELEMQVQIANMRAEVPWYHQVEGSAIANFVKKVIRKLIRFVIIPINEEQNAYNAAAAESLTQLLAYVKEQEQTIAKLQGEVERLKANRPE